MLKAIQLGQQLTKKEMKNINGGGTCCAHLSDSCADCGTGHWVCGLSKKDAIKKADELALWADYMADQYPGIGYEGVGGMWCCASCPQ